MLLSGVAVVALLLLVAVPVIPTRVVIVGIVAVRSLSDIGLSTGMRPGVLAWVNLGLVAVILYLVVVKAVATGGLGRTSRLTTVVGVFFFLSIVGFFHFGIDAELTSELLRVLSIIGIFILAYRYSDELTSMTVAAMVLPSALVGLIGSAGFGQGMVNSAGRLAGTFSHPNAAAAFLGVALVLSIELWLRRPGIGVLLMTAVLAAALLLTGSLGGITGALAGVIAVVWFFPSNSGSQRFLQIGAVSVCAYIGYVAFDLSARVAEFKWHSTGYTSTASADSFQWRLENWQLLVDIAAGSPVIGFGLGASSYQIMPLGGPPHSMYVQSFVDGGFIGVCVLGALIGAMIRSGVRFCQRSDWRGSAILGLGAFILVNGIVSNLLGYTAAMYLIAVLAAWLVRGGGTDQAGRGEPAGDGKGNERSGNGSRLRLVESGRA
ncbi:O-antigen ligase family protein [Rhodococcus ruber]|uniref:O-antigen ligase family protein n=1 Tax=Rhodococcus ruber TaxID=1830 RepID=UPI003783424A